MTDADFFWLAGWAEGEATFYLSNTQRAIFQVFSIDRDVIEKGARITGGAIYAIKGRGKSQSGWRLHLEGARAISLMTMLYPVMCERRKEQIVKAISGWEMRPNRPLDKLCACGCGRSLNGPSRTIYAIGGACAQRAYRNRQKKVAA